MRLALRYALPCSELSRSQIEEAAIEDSDLPDELEQEFKRMKNADADLFSVDERIMLQDVIATVDQLSVELIEHLKRHHQDIDKLTPTVLEHLVGEFMVAGGFEDVRLVGRDPRTSADLFAANLHRTTGTQLRFFLEIKRWKRKIGIEVINKVLGAMLSERPLIGWHASMIVSTGGFRRFARECPHTLSRKGVELRDRHDLLRWLADYQPTQGGLWLPRPERRLPDM